jgi:2-polyprenyl-6-methoxyphenol hydroxylase-like FAD-dependent oxidoreductase
VTALYDAQIAQINKILEEKPERFDYIFTNAPDNSHNQQKRLEAGMDNSVVMDGGYTVEIKIARYATVTKNKSPKAAALLNRFSAGMVLTGGDACVPPNPMAAYGATLACEAADMLVQLSVGQGHLNAILIELNHYGKEEWVEKVKTLKDMLAEYYEARNAAETYFQFVQTLICNLYSLPPQITIG